MRKYLTIGEVANLLQTTTSCIRFYEKKGLVKPHKIDENGYRLYDFIQLDYLRFLLLLRELNMPIEDLQTLCKDYTLDKYEAMLNRTSIKIDEEIASLNKKKQEIKARLDIFRRLKDIQTGVFYQEEEPERHLCHLYHDAVFEYSIKEVYDIYKTFYFSSINFTDSLYYLTDDHYHYDICIPVGQDTVDYASLKKVSLTGGTYLSYYQVNGDLDQDEPLQMRKEFDKYLAKHGLESIGPLILKEENQYTEIDPSSYTIKYQIRIQEKKG